MNGFQHDIAGGAGNLIITSVQSPNYAAGSAGWQIRKDGSAEFNNLVIRGTFDGNNFILSATGFFVYSGTPAAGTLLFSVTPDTTTADSFGNAVPNPGATSYANNGSFWSAVNIGGGVINWYKAASEAGPWTAEAGIGFTFNGITGGGLSITATAGISGSFNLPQPTPFIATLPTDNNSGTTWVSGERAFMNNNWVASVNSNFAALVAALQAAGILD